MLGNHRFFLFLLLVFLLSGISIGYAQQTNDTPDYYTEIEQLNGKRIGVQTGNDDWVEIVLADLPDAQISYYNTFADLAAALEAHKIDAFPIEEPAFRLMSATNDRIAMLDTPMGETYDISFMFPRTEAGQKLCAEIDEYLQRIIASGELDAIKDKWTAADEHTKTLPDYASFPAPKGTLVMVTEGEYAPFNYYRGSEVAGLEIDMAARFCEAFGYGLKIETMAYDGILPAIQSRRYDFAAAALNITDEHKESVYFSIPYYTCTTYLTVLKAPSAEGSSFLDSMKASFERTFMREGRWRLFAEGALNTMIITFLAVIFGTCTGFAAFMACRKGNAAANAITDFSIWLIQGTPTVVLLMILYYIIFGAFEINGLWVSVIAFSLIFGSSVFIMLKTGTGAVDRGQTEAAYALGFTEMHAFFTVILPQAAVHFMPTYKEAVANLIKATSIVGYIAVQDLTKMGDIVRSRTFEAFFPLIAVAVIYFVMAGAVNFAVGMIQNRITPSKRRRESILKGLDLEGAEIS